jgi:hypothetical protein
VNDEPQGGPEGMQPSDEELRAALEEQMRRITVHDVLVQTAVTLVNLGGRRLGLPGPDGGEAEPPDLEQAKLAIDGVRALLPLLPAEPQGPIRDAVAQLQMAFAQQARAGGGQTPPPDPGGGPVPHGEAAPGGGQTPGGQTPPPGPGDPRDEAERAKARSKIWTPPGT